MSKKILHVISNLNVGGAEVMLLRIASADPKQHVVISLQRNGILTNNFINCGITTFELNFYSLKGIRVSINKIYNIIDDHNISVLQSWMNHANILASLFCFAFNLKNFFFLKKKKIKLIWNIRHDFLKPRDNKLSTYLLQFVMILLSRILNVIIVFCSKSALDNHIRMGYPMAKCCYIPNGFDINLFQPNVFIYNQLRVELAIPIDSIIIGMIGRFHPLKDHDTFIEAARIVNSKYPKIYFVLVGNGVDDSNIVIRTAIKKASLQNNIFLLGERSDIYKIIPALTILCQSSKSEGFPNVLGEGMSCAVPCVATDVGDSKSLIGVTGIIVPHSNPTLLAMGLFEMLEYPDQKRNTIGLMARNRIISNFSINKIIEEYNIIYH